MAFLGQLEGFTPVAQESPIGLIGDQQIDVFGAQANSVTNRQRNLGDLPVAPGQHLGDLAFTEPDASLTRPRLPPLAGGSAVTVISPANSPYVRHSISRMGDCSDSVTRPTAAPSPGTAACALRRIVG